MSFLIACPNCGERPVFEFRFGGEIRPRPSVDATDKEWASYLFTWANTAGQQDEWWYHKFGCRRWMVALRDTVTNAISQSGWPGDESVEGP